MEIGEVKSFIQDFFNVGTLVIVGSGLSIAEGIPGMKLLSEELIKNLPEMLQKDELDEWMNIETDLKNGVGLETSLLKKPVSKSVEENIRSITNKVIGEYDKLVYKKIIECSHVLRFTSIIEKFNLSLYDVPVITTNYDRLIEYACESANIPYDNSFYGKCFPKFDPDNSKKSFNKGFALGDNKGRKQIFQHHVRLYKPHGCISWREVKGEKYSLSDYDIGAPLIITPGANKYRKGYLEPFDYHRERANKEIDQAGRYIFIGYGFNDDHLETHIRSVTNISKPILIITHSLTTNAQLLIEENSNIMAITCSSTGLGSYINWRTEEIEIPGKDLWSVDNLIKEIF